MEFDAGKSPKNMLERKAESQGDNCEARKTQAAPKVRKPVTVRGRLSEDSPRGMSRAPKCLDTNF